MKGIWSKVLKKRKIYIYMYYRQKYFKAKENLNKIQK